MKTKKTKGKKKRHTPKKKKKQIEAHLLWAVTRKRKAKRDK